MKYKKMTVWCSGNEKANTAKTNMIGFSICTIMFCILIIMFFACDLSEDKTNTMSTIDHIISGIGFLMFTWWIPLGTFFMAKESYEMIKINKRIPLFLYNIDEFVKLGTIPEEQFVIFLSKDGAVLALKKYEKESKYFVRGTKYFYEFTDYYENIAKEKTEVSFEN